MTQRKWPPPRPESVADFLNFLTEWSDCIFVRECIAGRWQSIALSDLPQGRFAAHAQVFINRGRLPPVMKPSDYVDPHSVN